jgi:formate dehydrogenase major subunit
LENILNEFNAVLVSTGTTKPTTINLPGLKSNQYLTGLEFMKRYNNGTINELNGDVIIIGGGFTAVDSARACARSARKLLGNKGNVTVVYRRTEEFMAADIEEREEIEKENIKILTLLSPHSVKTKSSRLQSVIFQKNCIKKSIHSEKGEILPIDGSKIELKCNHLIIAIGQNQDYSILPEGVSVAEKFKTTRANLFTAGDFLNGSLNVIQSIADGKEAAWLIDKYLTKEDRLLRKISIEKANDNGETGRQRNHDVQFNLPVQNIEVKNRIPGNPEVEKVYSDRETQVHSTRCYLCHYKLQIDPELCIQCKWCIDVSPRNCIKMVSHFEYDEGGVIIKANTVDNIEESTFIWIDNKNCIRCGRCLRVCPTGAISMKKTKYQKCY